MRRLPVHDDRRLTPDEPSDEPSVIFTAINNVCLRHDGLNVALSSRRVFSFARRVYSTEHTAALKLRGQIREWVIRRGSVVGRLGVVAGTRAANPKRVLRELRAAVGTIPQVECHG